MVDFSPIRALDLISSFQERLSAQFASPAWGDLHGTSLSPPQPFLVLLGSTISCTSWKELLRTTFLQETIASSAVASLRPTDDTHLHPPLTILDPTHPQPVSPLISVVHLSGKWCEQDPHAWQIWAAILAHSPLKWEKEYPEPPSGPPGGKHIHHFPVAISSFSASHIPLPIHFDLVIDWNDNHCIHKNSRFGRLAASLSSSWQPGSHSFLMGALTLSVQSSFGQKISSSELSTPMIMSWMWGTSLSALQS